MEALVVVLVLAAAAMHATWNALVKSGGDRVATALQLNLTASVAALPLALAAGLPEPASWPYLAASVALHNVYFWLLVLAYRVGDLSQVYPLARGSAPLIVAALAYLLAGEALGPLGLAAVAVVSLGITSLALAGAGPGRGGAKPVLFALAIGVLISGYTVADGLGARVAGGALGYIAWLFLLDAIPFALAVALVRRRATFAGWGASWRRGAASGMLGLVGYGLVIWAMSLVPLTYVSALRETSVVMAALIGSRLLGEPFGARRVAAAGVVAAGVVLLQVAGTA